ncbi:uncharacterized protein LOC143470235 [Clavelina lepadiformis]|uniref:uncharacterized protein LOC143470235 n=1 Tax=Clavelina lepadiformis TaxID=159417 RepID=UPI0040422B65
MNENEGRFGWCADSTAKLIEVYKLHPCLYNTKSAGHKDRLMRQNAWEYIAAEMGTTVVDITKKVRGLRTQYAREKSKALRQVAEIGGGESSFQSTWVHYPALRFLEEFTTTKHKETTEWNLDYIQDNDEDATFEHGDSIHSQIYRLQDHKVEVKEYIREERPASVDNSLVFYRQPQLGDRDSFRLSNHIDASKRKQKTDGGLLPHTNDFHTRLSTDSFASRPKRQIERRESHDSVVEMPPAKRLAFSSTSEDEDEIFAKYIASELRQISDSHVKRVVKHDIQNLIFEAHCVLQNGK